MLKLSHPRPPTTLKTHVQTMDNVQDALKRAHSDYGTWRKVSIKLYGCIIPAGTLSAIAKGREPRNPEYRRLLNLPILAPAPVCPKCGVVHVSKRCPRNSNHRDLFSIPKSLLAWMIEYREEL